MLICKIFSRTISTSKSTEHGDREDYQELLPWEVEEKWNICKEDLLKSHGEANHCANQNTKKTASHNKYECFINVQRNDSLLGYTHSSHYSNFLGLLKQISCHRGTQREKAKEHCDCNNNVEDDVQD